MRRKISLLIMFILIFTLVIGCSNENKKVQENVEITSKEEVESKESKESEKVVEKTIINTMGKTFSYEKIPEKIFTNELNLLEILIELGLEDKVVAYASGHFNAEQSLEKNRDIIKDLNYVGDYVSLESVVDTGADFAYINPTSFSDRISIDEFIDKNINIYACRANYVKAANFEDVYEDILNIGRIFNIEEKAEEIVINMRKEQENIRDKNDPEKEKAKILVYDFGDSDVFTAGLGLESAIISLAGGENIFSDINTPWARVSWEEIINRNPEIIIIHEYPGSDDFDAKKEFLLNNEILQDVDAIKNKRFIKLPMINVFTGMQLNDGIKIINQEIESYANQ